MTKIFTFLFVLLITFSSVAGTPARITRIQAGWGSSPAPLPYSKNYYQQWISNKSNQARFMTYAVPRTASGVTTIPKPRPLVATITPQSLSKALAKRARAGAAFLPPPVKLALLAAGLAEIGCEATQLCWKTDYTEGDPTMQRYPAVKKTVQSFTCHLGSPAAPPVGSVTTSKPITSEELRDLRRQCAPKVAGQMENNCPSSRKCGTSGAPTYNYTPQGATVSLGYKMWSDQSTCQGTMTVMYCTADVAIMDAGFQTVNTCPPDTSTLGNVPRILEYSKVYGDFCVLPWYPKPVTDTAILPTIKTGPIDGFDPADLINPDGTPDPDMFENPEFPSGLSDQFYDAADSIIQGTAQTSDPSAPNYMTSNTYNTMITQITNWVDNRAFYDPFSGTEHQPTQPNPTPTDPSPGQMSWDDFPGITQSQYEQSNNQWALQVDPSLKAENVESATSKLEDNFLDMVESVDQTMPFETAEFFGYFTLPTTGQCSGFTIPTFINGRNLPVVVDQHCPPYEDWGRPLISWFISLLTVLNIFHIFRRTLEIA